METTYCLSQASPVKRKVLGDIHNKINSPISPTANLKLLTKVAAARYDSIENANVFLLKSEAATPPNSKITETEPTTLSVGHYGKGVRKFKSLRYLCDKFLKLYPLNVPEHTTSLILLTTLAQHLGVEKRRVYDIINVVESLQMATKVGKNRYRWVGRLKLADTLALLKTYAEQTGLVEYVRTQQLRRNLYVHLHAGEVETTESSVFSENSSTASFFRNERRSGVLCQKFIMIFLVSLKEGVVNLDLAADVLMGEQSKMRLRRLYDIANILVSLGVIEKVDGVNLGWKKPAFRYVGPPVQSQKLDIDVDCPLLRKLMMGEATDTFNPDFSEDSSEVSGNKGEQTENVSITDIDHSYSRYTNRGSGKPVAVVEPAAKKRLIFSADVRKMVLQNSTPMRVSSSELSQNYVLKVKVKEEQCEENKMILQNSTPSVPSSESSQNSLLQVKVKKEQCCQETTELVKTAPSSSILRVLGQGFMPQPIQHGAVYKAVKVGNDIQLIRIDDC